MEGISGSRSGHGGLVVKGEIKRVESNGDEEEDCNEGNFALKIGKSRNEYDDNEDIKRSSSSQKYLGGSKEENDQLESTRAEIGEVREENQRLKMYLGRITKDYETLQMQFNNIVQQEAAKKSIENSENNHDEAVEETKLVSLTLGSFSSNPKINKEVKNKIPSNNVIDVEKDQNEKQVLKEGLSLGLSNYKDINEASRSGATDQGGPAVSNPSAVSSFEEPKEEAGETWPPSKVLKEKRSAEDEVSQQNQVKKARVCVRARCDTPTMNDGCQWRKYGQKIAKGNPCPRAYYRCTVAPSCPVRKQVQRYADDISILITTYEGTHNHPLPLSATAMASTTSAAASMLLSGSSTSSGTRPPSTELHGFSTFDSSKWNFNKFISSPYSPYSSFSSSHPTITLDLTTTPSSSSLNKFSSSSSISPINYPHHTTLYPSTSLSFGSSDSNTNTSWNHNNNNGFLSYGSSTTQAYNLKSQIGALASLGRQTTSLHANNNNNNNVNYYSHNSMQKGNPSTNQVQSMVLPDTIAAATKAITADPTFQSALVAALTSVIGGGQGSNNVVQGGGDHNSNIYNNVVQKLKWGGEHTHHHDHNSTGIGGCSSTFLNKEGLVGNSQPAGNLMFSSPNSLSFSASKSASASPGDTTREQTS